MGYFSNGSEGVTYEEQYCDRCIHNTERGCPIWLLHQLYNYEECNNANSMLHVLIPRSQDKLDNEQCSMFLDEALLSPLAREKYQSAALSPTPPGEGQHE